MEPHSYPYPKVHEVLRMAKDILGADRLLWGTDAPFAATSDTYTHLHDYLLKGDAFTEDELQKVYYDNAKKVCFG